MRRSSIAGVYVHATAVSNLIGRNAVIEPGRLPATLIAIVFAALAAVAARMLPPVGAALTYLGAVAAYILGAAAAFTYSPLALPLSGPIMGGFMALVIMVGYRFVVADQEDQVPAQELRALPRAPGHRNHADFGKDAGARRRDARHHGAFSRTCRILDDLREDAAECACGVDERVFVGDDGYHRKLRRLHRQSSAIRSLRYSVRR